MMRTFVESNGATVQIDAGKIEKIWAIARNITAVEHTTRGYFEVVRVRNTLAEIAVIAMLPLAKKAPLTGYSEAALVPAATIDLFDIYPEKIGYRLRAKPIFTDEYMSHCAAFIKQFSETLAMIGSEIKPTRQPESNDE